MKQLYLHVIENLQSHKYKMVFKKISILLLVLFLGVLPNSFVFAQESDVNPNLEATQSAQDSELEVFTRDRETQKIVQLRTLYRDQVEVYRNSEKAYSIAKTNFEQVETLAALEEAVKATKLVMMERSRVLITYLELLDSVLIETNGIELDFKNQSHTELTGLINALKIHRDNINLSTNREAMVVLADEFEPINFSYTTSVYKTLSLIRIGKIQEVRDKSEIIKTDIEKRNNAEDVSSVLVSKRKRAYTEIERNFATVNENLVKLNNQFLEAKVDGFTRSFYERILRDLGPIYAQISKSLDHLEELVTL